VNVLFIEQKITILTEPFKDKNNMEEKRTHPFAVYWLSLWDIRQAMVLAGLIVAATTFVWRIFWTLAILGASGMFAMEVMNLFKLYLSRPVQTSVTVTFEKVYYHTLYLVFCGRGVSILSGERVAGKRSGSFKLVIF
jgi:hypothetical protein